MLAVSSETSKRDRPHLARDPYPKRGLAPSFWTPTLQLVIPIGALFAPSIQPQGHCSPSHIISFCIESSRHIPIDIILLSRINLHMQVYVSLSQKAAAIRVNDVPSSFNVCLKSKPIYEIISRYSCFALLPHTPTQACPEMVSHIGLDFRHSVVWYERLEQEIVQLNLSLVSSALGIPIYTCGS